MAKATANITVTLTAKKRLKKALNEAGFKDRDAVAGLSITGTITDEDIKYLNDNMRGDLKKLDMSNAFFKENTIPKDAFGNCYCLASVNIPASVTKIIGRVFDSFYLTNIKVHPDNPVYFSKNGILFNKKKSKLLYYPEGRKGNYVIPDSVTEIENDAFNECHYLTSVTIPNSVTKIGNCAFRECLSLTSITIPNSVTEIGNCAFHECRKLTSITIPDSITEIKDSTFYKCSNLVSINIPASVTKIGDGLFLNCDSLTTITVHSDNSVYSSKNGVLFNKDKTKLLYYPEGSHQGNYVIPDSVTEIGKRVFFNCSSDLTAITIPQSVMKIEEEAFEDCSGLTFVDIPASVTEIGARAFIGCNKLSFITVHPDNPVYSSENGILFNKNKSKLLYYPEGRQGDYVIPDSVTEIGEWAFNSSYFLKSINIPASVKKIGERAFCESPCLTSINIPALVTEIGEKAFSGCNSLASITVHPGNTVYENKNGKIKFKKINI